MLKNKSYTENLESQQKNLVKCILKYTPDKFSDNIFNKIGKMNIYNIDMNRYN